VLTIGMGNNEKLKSHLLFKGNIYLSTWIIPWDFRDKDVLK
jgi:hypothetical protein